MPQYLVHRQVFLDIALDQNGLEITACSATTILHKSLYGQKRLATPQV